MKSGKDIKIEEEEGSIGLIIKSKASPADLTTEAMTPLGVSIRAKIIRQHFRYSQISVASEIENLQINKSLTLDFIRVMFSVLGKTGERQSRRS
jgi:uncharacterized membrane protein YcaP (DUF421 family)